MSCVPRFRLRRVLCVLALSLALCALSVAPAGAAPAAQPARPGSPPATHDGSGRIALPAGAVACASTAAKPSSATATCDATAAAGPAGTERTSLPAGASSCVSTGAKPSSAGAACSGSTGQAASALTQAPLASWSVTLSASRTALAPGETTHLTAVANQDVGPTPFFIELFDATSHTFLVACGAGTSCSTDVTQTGSTLRYYVAFISLHGTGYPPPGVQASSSAVGVIWVSVTLKAAPSVMTPGGTTILTATASMDVGPTPYFIEIFDLTSGANLAICGSGTMCATSVTQFASTVRRYVAYVSGHGTTVPPPNVAATSNAILVSWLSVTLTTDRPVLPVGGQGRVTATASLDVAPTPFFIDIVDLTSNTSVAICGFGTICSAVVMSPVPTWHVYLAYISGFGTAQPPPNVRAASTPLFVSWV